MGFELSGQIKDMSIDFKTGKINLTMSIIEKQDAMVMFDELHECEKIKIKIDKYREKRSLDANAYFFVLCGKLAAKLQQNKTDIYKRLVREIGDNYEVLPIRNDAVEKFIAAWGEGKLGWVCDVLGESKFKGYTNICAYYGSSTYNSKQMSDLINSIIFECQEQGIETETPEQIAKMISLWGEK